MTLTNRRWPECQLLPISKSASDVLVHLLLVERITIRSICMLSRPMYLEVAGRLSSVRQLKTEGFSVMESAHFHMTKSLMLPKNHWKNQRKEPPGKSRDTSEGHFFGRSTSSYRKMAIAQSSTLLKQSLVQRSKVPQTMLCCIMHGGLKSETRRRVHAHKRSSSRILVRKEWSLKL